MDGSSLYLVLIAKLRRLKLFLHNLCREHHDPGVDRHVTVQNLVQDHLEGALLLIEWKLSKVHRAAQGDVGGGLGKDIVELILLVQL